MKPEWIIDLFTKCVRQWRLQFFIRIIFNVQSAVSFSLKSWPSLHQSLSGDLESPESYFENARIKFLEKKLQQQLRIFAMSRRVALYSFIRTYIGKFGLQQIYKMELPKLFRHLFESRRFWFSFKRWSFRRRYSGRWIWRMRRGMHGVFQREF